ncbi:MAG: DUF1896 family protein [Rikenellaceae bacterium]
MNTKQNNIELSFYQLSLLAFLIESHPELSTNRRFIKNRAKQAAAEFARAFDEGFNIQECSEIANKTLYAGLHFSRHNTIENILWSEFANDVEIDYSRECAIALRLILEPIFAKYEINDDFAYTPEFQSLYTELVGAIQLKQEEDGKL